MQPLHAVSQGAAGVARPRISTPVSMSEGGQNVGPVPIRRGRGTGSTATAGQECAPSSGITRHRRGADRETVMGGGRGGGQGKGRGRGRGRGRCTITTDGRGGFESVGRHGVHVGGCVYLYVARACTDRSCRSVRVQ